jgi:hypothetical protein
MEIDREDCARALRSPEAVAHRRGMLDRPQIAPLTAFVSRLRAAHPEQEFPEFDPLDGGVNADILFLFEKPGPMTSADGKGSGFISRNNDDPTAEATFNFMKEAALTRKRTVLWNVIPGWNGKRAIATAELLEGVNSLKDMLPLLRENLRTIVLVGRKAERASSLIEPLGLRILISAHPSPLVRASQPQLWRTIPSIWARARSDDAGWQG